ncbi:hypothetical protein L1987_01375 [Smallanthus sonchifolius]|uniref:Uncharacterized protein n=1 Tax=Smallanthus sonchifolius TaxID=185202 RepID=A0ACB9K4W0_9ASTR|nr:hypothetical protein L1987_01375 [Smallanthus sonchifolius]
MMGGFSGREIEGMEGEVAEGDYHVVISCRHGFRRFSSLEYTFIDPFLERYNSKLAIIYLKCFSRNQQCKQSTSDRHIHAMVLQMDKIVSAIVACFGLVCSHRRSLDGALVFFKIQSLVRTRLVEVNVFQ